MKHKNKIIAEYMASIGAAGGSAGRGDAKKRGSSAYYAKLSKLARKARAAKKSGQK